MSWELDIENVAGIRNGKARLTPGVNAVRGTNWQGKSSLLAAIRTALGTDAVLTEGAERGHVELDMDDQTIRVDLERENGDVRRRGEPFLDDERAQACANLYAFLGEDNEIRRAVRNGENLEGLLTHPLDFENIDERITELEREREQVDADLDAAERATKKLSEVEMRITELEENLAELRDRRAELAAEHGENVTEHREALSDALADRQTVTSTVDRLERSVERTREKIAERREELADLEVPTTADDVEQRLAEARERFEQAERDADLLQSIYAPTKRILEEDRLDLISDIDRGLVEDEVTCWTCGNDATREAVAAQVSALGERVTNLRQEAATAREEVDRLQAAREERQDAQRRQRDLEESITDLEATLEERKTSLEHARERLDEVESRIDDLSDRVEHGDDQLTDIDSEIKYTEARLEDVREERADLEERAARRDKLRSQRENLTEQITDLRTRKRKLKQRTRDAFDEAMVDIIDRFETGFETARLTSEFDIVVARDGREASLDALSEGEIELIGVIAALAGHEAFDTGDDVPVLLLDNLGGLADDNLRTLISYLEDRAEYLVFTTYPEHEGFGGNIIDPTSWDVVSDTSRAAT